MQLTIIIIVYMIIVQERSQTMFSLCFVYFLSITLEEEDRKTGEGHNKNQSKIVIYLSY